MLLMSVRILLLIMAIILPPHITLAQGRACSGDNFRNRKAATVNLAPMLSLTAHSFCNSNGEAFKGQYLDSLAWKNVGARPVAAFEVTFFRFDPFNRPLKHRSLILPGRMAGGWDSLSPNAIASDSFSDTGTELVMTSIAAVRAVRMSDGTIWQADNAQLLEALKRAAPDIRDWGKF